MTKLISVFTKSNKRTIKQRAELRTYGSACLTVLMLFLSLPVFISCRTASQRECSVTFLVALEDTVIDQGVFLTGDHAKLGNWSPDAVPMKKISDSVWSCTLKFFKGEHLEYKITSGSWWTQMVEANGTVSKNLELHVAGDTIIYITIHQWLNRMVNHRPLLSRSRFASGRPSMDLGSLWKYHSGDNIQWSSASYADTDWVVTNALLRSPGASDIAWNGMGWFRFHFYADSSIWKSTLAFRVQHLGASQIYYNGKLLYTYGNVGTDKAHFTPNSMTWWRTITIDPQYEQTFAVRYANYDWQQQEELGFTPGFLITLDNVNAAFRMAVDIRENSERQMIFILIPLVLAFVHLALYGFLREQRQNLYYGLCMLGFSGLTFFGYERNLVVEVARIILFSKLTTISVGVSIFFGMLTILEINYESMPRRVWFYFGLFVMTTGMVLLNVASSSVMAINYILFGGIILEGVYSLKSKRTKNLSGGWLLFAGFIALSFFIFLQVMTDYGMIARTQFTGQSYAYGMLSLAVSMSLFLSYRFAHVNKNLAIQLEHVNRLSEKTLEQERQAHQMKLDRKVMEIDNQRKTEELEAGACIAAFAAAAARTERSGIRYCCKDENRNGSERRLLRLFHHRKRFARDRGR